MCPRLYSTFFVRNIILHCRIQKYNAASLGIDGLNAESGQATSFEDSDLDSSENTESDDSSETGSE